MLAVQTLNTTSVQRASSPAARTRYLALCPRTSHNSSYSKSNNRSLSLNPSNVSAVHHGLDTNKLVGFGALPQHVVCKCESQAVITNCLLRLTHIQQIPLGVMSV